MMIIDSQKTKALPSYARQTGMACNTCHITFPQLNQFGRQFKLNAYTLSAMESVEAKGDSDQVFLKLMRTLPISGMVQTSFTHISKEAPNTSNDNFSFPQQLSFLFAGEITPKIGLFLQITYNDATGSFGWDNTDIRYADNTSLFSNDLLWGFSLNNNPSVQDLLHTTPAWGFPFTSLSVGYSPGASPLIAGALAQKVIGFGIFGLWDNLIYAELSGYRSAPQGGPHPADTSSVDFIKGIAPYWRLALQQSWASSYLALGTYGMMTNKIPFGITGNADKFTDIGFDLQYENQMGSNWLTGYFTWIHENMDLAATNSLNGSQNKTNTLDALKLNINYFFMQQFNISAGYFSTVGSKDNILYAPGALIGFSGNQPNTDGFTLEFSYLPWFNTRFSIQYINYNKFNGASDNYDGFQRKASDNNSIYLLGWIMF